MLIRFSVENFLSIKDRQTFSMIPGKGTLKSDHRTKPIKGVSVLKSAVIFGANASGKSNIIKAIDFGRKLVLRGIKPDQNIDFQNFRLDTEFINKDSRIEYEIQHRNKNYAYGFVFNKNEIIEEWLYEISKTQDLKIFERNKSVNGIFDLEFLYSKNKNDDEKQFLKFIAKGTPNNQLFLTEIRTRKVKENVTNIDDILNVIDWFQNSLKVISPNDKYNEGLKFELKSDEKLLNAFQELLEYFDTGIDGVCLKKVDFDNIDVPTKILNQIREDLLNVKSENLRASILSNFNTTYFLSKKDNEIHAEKFMTKHKVKGQNEDELFERHFTFI